MEQETPQMQEAPQAEPQMQPSIGPEPTVEPQLPYEPPSTNEVPLSQSPPKKKSNILPIILIVLAFILLIGGGAYFLWQKFGYLLKPEIPLTNESITPELNGEITPDVASPVILNNLPNGEFSGPPPISGPSPDEAKSDAVMIQESLAGKYGKQASEVKLAVSENTGEYASGTVNFADEVGGGWWLAAKSAGSWVLVADGNGSVMCSDILDYNFPTDMVPECYDDATGQVVKR